MCLFSRMFCETDLTAGCIVAVKGLRPEVFLQTTSKTTLGEACKLSTRDHPCDLWLKTGLGCARTSVCLLPTGSSVRRHTRAMLSFARADRRGSVDCGCGYPVSWGEVFLWCGEYFFHSLYATISLLVLLCLVHRLVLIKYAIWFCQLN